MAPPVAPAEGEERPCPLSRMRRVIADRLTSSWQTTPHFTVTVAVDVTRLLALRAELKAAILAVSSAIPTPVALHGGIAVRSVMKLTLSADHRLVDGGCPVP